MGGMENGGFATSTASGFGDETVNVSSNATGGNGGDGVISILHQASDGGDGGGASASASGNSTGTGFSGSANATAVGGAGGRGFGVVITRGWAPR